ncbi:MAG: hypothetical protein JKY56_16115 [Kofleriaceae bacterium]|nr:hypothetical protein [Kofleriaceae bacterium]
MLNSDMLLATLLWPMVAVAVVLSTLWIPALQRSRSRALFVTSAAVAAGAVVGYWGIIGAPQWPLAIDAKARIPIIALLALVATGLSLRFPARIPSLLLGLVLALCAERLLLVAAIEFQWTQTQAIVRVLVLAVGMLVMLVSAGQLQRELPSRLSIFIVAIVAGLPAPLMAFSDSLVLAQLHGALGVSMGLLCVATWVFPSRVLSGSVHTVAIALSWSLWTICLLFANMPTLSFVLVVSALPLANIVLILSSKLSVRTRHLLVVSSVMVALLSSLALGGLRYKSTSEATPASDDDYGYGYE